MAIDQELVINLYKIFGNGSRYIGIKPTTYWCKESDMKLVMLHHLEAIGNGHMGVVVLCIRSIIAICDMSLVSYKYL